MRYGALPNVRDIASQTTKPFWIRDAIFVCNPRSAGSWFKVMIIVQMIDKRGSAQKRLTRTTRQETTKFLHDDVCYGDVVYRRQMVEERLRSSEVGFGAINAALRHFISDARRDGTMVRLKMSHQLILSGKRLGTLGA